MSKDVKKLKQDLQDYVPKWQLRIAEEIENGKGRTISHHTVEAAFKNNENRVAPATKNKVFEMGKKILKQLGEQLIKEYEL